MRRPALALLAAAVLCTAPAWARDSLGIYGVWGAFRDAEVPRCYAIAMAQPSTRSREGQPFASVGIWPQQRVRGQLHLRLSRTLATGAVVTLNVGGARFRLTGNGSDAWSANPRDDAAVISAMRGAASMQASARDLHGAGFSDRYDLAGAATAIDAALVGCARGQ